MNTTGNANYKSESTGQPDAFNQFYADNTAALKLIAKLEAERDEYKAKLAAYERAIAEYNESDGSENFFCHACIHKEYPTNKLCWACGHWTNCLHELYSNFTFDYARFANKGGEGER